MLEILAQASVVVNCAIAYFTSKELKFLFTADAYHMKALEFFMLVVAVEHAIYILKLVIRQLADDGDDQFLG